MAESIRITKTALACVQDLGRSAAHLGISRNGAADEYSARLANALVGNTEDAALLELTAMPISMSATVDLWVAVTGASAQVSVDRVSAPLWTSLHLPAGAELRVENIRDGLRCYVAIDWLIDSERFLGSVAPDKALGFGHWLRRGDQLGIEPPAEYYHAAAGSTPEALIPRYGEPCVLSVVAGPEREELSDSWRALLGAEFVVSMDSNHVGIRLDAVGETQTPPLLPEMRSRGIPIGAVEVTPAGQFIILHRGRSVTAGYPVVAVVTRTSLSAAGQQRPGDRVVFREVSIVAASNAYLKQRRQIRQITQRSDK